MSGKLLSMSVNVKSDISILTGRSNEETSKQSDCIDNNDEITFLDMFLHVSINFVNLIS